MAYIGPEPAESFTSFATQEFSTSATTSYTLDHAVANENEIALFVNNVRQQPGSGKAYTATGTALTLSAATASTDTMYCIFLGRALQTVVPATNSVTTSMLSINGGELNLDADEDTSITADTDDQIDFKTGGTDRLKIDSTDVTVSTGNIVFGTADKGVYLGVTSATAANLLDDYEEGTFTPEITDGIGSRTHSAQNGAYTKIGNICYVRLRVDLSAGTANGNHLTISGLPFTSANTTTNAANGFVFPYADSSIVNSTSTNLPTLYTQSNITNIKFYKTTGATFTGNDLNSASSASFYIAGVYSTA